MASSRGSPFDKFTSDSDDPPITSLAFLHSLSEPVLVINSDREIVLLNEKCGQHLQSLGVPNPEQPAGRLYPEILEKNLLELSKSKVNPLLEKIQNLYLGEGAQSSIRIPDRENDLQVNMRSFELESKTFITIMHRPWDLKKQVLRENRRRLSLALNGAQAGIWDWNLKTDEEYWDRNTEELFGLEPGEFDGTYQGFAKFVLDEDLPELEEATQEAIDCCGGYEKEFRIRRADGKKRWLLSRGEVYTDSRGNPDTMIGVTMDITEKKETEKALEQALEEKETLMAEIHHRVKNNLQMISSLLNMQSRTFESEEVKETLQDSRARVRALAIIHENLYQSSNVENINIKEYLSDLVENLLTTYNARDTVSCRTEILDCNIDLDRGIACGLIVNELVTNSLEHGLDVSEGGTIKISFRRTTGESFSLTVEDDGKGFDPDFKLSEARSTGLKIVQSLAEFELDGSVEIQEDDGARVKIKF